MKKEYLAPKAFVAVPTPNDLLTASEEDDIGSDIFDD